MKEINKIYNENCLIGMADIDDKSIDMICTDLPYGQTARNKWDCVIPFRDYVEIENKIYYDTDIYKISYLLNLSLPDTQKWFKQRKKTGLWTHYERIIKENGAIILFANGMFTAELMESNKKLWRYNLIWEKTQPTGFLNANKMPLRSHEDICIFYKKLPTYNPQKTSGHERKISKAEHRVNGKESLNYGSYGLWSYDSTERYPKSIWTYAKDVQKSALHPTQKPIALIEELIKTYSNPGDIILDSCAGSCTTAVAAIKTGRRYICMEKDPEICAIGLNRVQNIAPVH